MTDIGNLIGRLHTIRDQLRTGAVGQREVWEEWLAEAADELDQLTGSKAALQTEIERLRKLNDDQQVENERLQKHATSMINEMKHTASVDFTQWRAETVRLNAEIKRLCRRNEVTQEECVRLKKILDGTERRECEYLALVEKHATEVERMKEAVKHAEKMVYDSGFQLGEAHTEIARLKAERHTTKEMLEDVLYRHGVVRPGRP